MPVCNLAPREVILADVLRNSSPRISPPLPDTREYGWIDFAATDCDDLICLRPRVLPFSSALLHLPPARSLWQEPSQLGIDPAARFPSLPFITVVGTDPLRRGSRSPEDPLDFRTGAAHAVLVGRAHMYTHTHTQRIPRSIVDISFVRLYLFFSQSESIHLCSDSASWVNVMNPFTVFR